MKVTAALNLHTSLTASAGQGLSPVKLVEQLKERKVQVAALTDVNTALNCPAFAVLCRSAGIAPLFGMEARAAAGARAVILFSDLETALSFSDAWYKHLQPGSSGIPQYYVDEGGSILGSVAKPLNTDSTVPLPSLLRAVQQHRGIAIAAAIHHGVPIHEYAPLKIKMAITGTGSASKEQVAGMLQRILNLDKEEMPKFMDATDALGAAYCHFMQMNRPESEAHYKGWKDFIVKNKERVKK